ncbi:MAG: sigma-E processing peptidase SpoIIGA [Clostridiales bacterium]|nr:sigma-E processing peptidase SpoIIGA [Clostridiales bacterium]
MYYEVYVDVLFIENLWMNVILLLLTAWADQIPVKAARVAAAACFGSLGACVLTVASAWLYGIHYFLGAFILAAGMIAIVFPDRKHFFSRMLFLYIESFLLNGILGYLEQFHSMSGVWFVIFSSVSWLCLTAAEYFRNRRKQKRELVCSAVLQNGMCRITVEALWDTGNGLYDPVSGHPVCILEGRLLNRLLEESGRERILRVIPYHTISQSGILEAYILEEMELSGSKGNRHVKNPVIARMPEEGRQYPLILHRDLMPS